MKNKIFFFPWQKVSVQVRESFSISFFLCEMHFPCYAPVNRPFFLWFIRIRKKRANSGTDYLATLSLCHVGTFLCLQKLSLSSCEAFFVLQWKYSLCSCENILCVLTKIFRENILRLLVKSSLFSGDKFFVF